MKISVLASLRERCDLGLPPFEYNQNCNESIISLIKQSKGHQKLTLTETVQFLRKEVNV